MSAARVFTRGEFDRFFARKYLELLRWALSPGRRPRYRDPALLAQIAEGYRGLMPSTAPHAIPRRIFMLWQQGWDTAPSIVRACADSWRRHNPGWELHLLDDRSLSRVAPADLLIEAPGASRPARSDLVRMALLRANGGIWADATLFCTRPLDDWLPLAANAGLFMFSRPRPYRWFDVWFMAASAGNPVIAAWHDMVRQYWGLFRRPHHYYWLPYLFEHLAAVDPAVLAAWHKVPVFSALGPLAVAGAPFAHDAPRALFDLIAENRVPVHKLGHKWLGHPTLAGTPLGALTGLSRL